MKIRQVFIVVCMVVVALFAAQYLDDRERSGGSSSGKASAESENKPRIKWTPPKVDTCKPHVVLHSAAVWAEEIGRSEDWILMNHKINLWSKTTPEGRGRKVGEMRPGSHALILEEGAEDYKVRSPFDGSEGWIGKIQVKTTIKQDTESRKPC